MAENPEVSGQPGDAGELPTPSFSESATSPTSTDADAIVSKLLEKLTPVIEQTVDRQVQSKRDKWIGKIQKTLGSKVDLLAELEEQGVTIPKEVRSEIRMRELEERLAEPSAQPAPRSVDGSTGQKAAVTEALAELNKYGLNSNDPAFIELLRGNYANRDAFDKAVYGHIVAKLAPPKPANPADVVQPPATAQANGSGDTATKIARLAELQKQPTKYRNEIKQLAEELDKAGWK